MAKVKDKATAKLVYFGKDDDSLWEFASNIPNFSEWVRGYVRLEMGVPAAEGGESGLMAVIERIVEQKLGGRKSAPATTKRVYEILGKKADLVVCDDPLGAEDRVVDAQASTGDEELDELERLF